MLIIAIGKWDLLLTIVRPEPARLSDLGIWPLYSVEFLVNIMTSLYIPRLIIILDKTSLFHMNLVRISQALCIIYYPGLAARAVLFLYEVNVLTPEDSIHSIVLVLACFVRIWSINVVTLYMPSAIIERVFASKYVTDYEKFPRPMIYRTIISFLYIISAIIAFFDMLGYFEVSVRVWSGVALCIGYSIAYVTLYRHDLVKFRDISHDIHARNVIYTLSTKFQLKENLRVMKILMQLSIMWAICTLIACVSFMLAINTLSHHSQWSQMCHVLMNVFVAMWHTVIVWVFTVAVGGFCLQCILPFDTKIGMIHGDRATNDHRGASDAYFKQLSTKWEMHAMPRMRSQEEKYVYN